MDALSDTSALEEERTALDPQIESEALTIREAVAENARIAQDQEEFRKKYDEMVAKYNSLISQRDAIQSQIDEKIDRREKIGRFIRQVEALPALITEFDAALWAALIESVTIETDGRIVFHLTCGTEVEVPSQT